MATSEMELVICQLLDKIETKFRRLDLHFRGPAFERDKFKHSPTKPGVEYPKRPHTKLNMRTKNKSSNGKVSLRTDHNTQCVVFGSCHMRLTLFRQALQMDSILLRDKSHNSPS